MNFIAWLLEKISLKNRGGSICISEQVPPPYLQWPTLAPARAPLGTNPDAPHSAALSPAGWAHPWCCPVRRRQAQHPIRCWLGAASCGEGRPEPVSRDGRGWAVVGRRTGRGLAASDHRSRDRRPGAGALRFGGVASLLEDPIWMR